MMRVDAREKLGRSLAKWFHANDIPGRKANYPFFRAAIKLAQQLGEWVHIPNGREIDGLYLDMNYEEMEAHMLEYGEEWSDYGVTVMSYHDVHHKFHGIQQWAYVLPQINKCNRSCPKCRIYL
uniref:Uncharacterized protein n=1 Tax=Oryza brachyantha TaxID=4533 RepID=J3NDC8_ORYBR